MATFQDIFYFAVVLRIFSSVSVNSQTLFKINTIGWLYHVLICTDSSRWRTALYLHFSLCAQLIFHGGGNKKKRRFQNENPF
jgi:hypothetical protein